MDSVAEQVAAWRVAPLTLTPPHAGLPGYIQKSPSQAKTMSIPLLIGLIVMAIIIAAAVGVWKARTKGALNAQSSLILLLLVVLIGGLVFYLLSGRF